MKKTFLLMLGLMAVTAVMAQSTLENISQRAINKGFILLRQDYQLLNEDDEPVGLKPGKECYGTSYTCAVRFGTDNYIANRDFFKPWNNDKTIVKGSTNTPKVSYTGYRDLKTVEFEELDADPETASEILENHLYTFGGSEIEGFETDECYGKKRGFAVWMISDKPFDANNAPGKLSLDIKPMNITTRENTQVYDLTQQPTGNVIGGAYLVPSLKGVGKIEFRINGLFEKIGGVWKFISLGTDEPDDEDELF